MKELPYLLATVLVVAVMVGTAAYFMVPSAVAFPIPATNVNVTAPKGVAYKQLTTGAEDDFWPSWSPNGSLIAYVSGRSGQPALWIMSASGSGAFQVSRDSQATGYPSWSPNSTMVAYWSLTAQSSGISIYVLGSNSTIQVPGSSPVAAQAKPAWSPDGTRLAFYGGGVATQLVVYTLASRTLTVVANTTGPYPGVTWASNEEVLYTTWVEGNEQINSFDLLTGSGAPFMAGDGNYTAPVVGPDGSVAYYSDFNPGAYSMYYVGYGGFNIWVADPDGANQTFQYVTAIQNEGGSTEVQIPYIPGDIDITCQPAWSPDGSLLVYTAYASGTGYSMFMWDVWNWASTQIGPYGSGNCIQPSWSPAGDSIAFSSNMGGFYHIWILSVNGNLTSSLVGY